jgi:multidrug resistance efflux pump
MSRKLLLAGGSLVVAVALAAAAFRLWYRPDSNASEPPPKVSAAEITELLIPVTVRARDVVTVPSPIEGTVESFHVEVGDEVFEGQALAFIRSAALESAKEQAYSVLEQAQDKTNRLESAVIEGRLEASRASADASRARSEYERAEREYKRQQILIREGATPRLTWEKAEREYASTKAEFETLDALAKQVAERIDSMTKELDNARKALEEKRQEYEDASFDAGAADLRSPVDGLVVARRGGEGDAVSREVTDLFQIAVDLSTFEAVGEADPNARGRVHPGQHALIHFAELGEGVSAQVKFSEAGTIVLEFPNPGPAVRPGATGQARIRLVP